MSTLALAWFGLGAGFLVITGIRAFRPPRRARDGLPTFRVVALGVSGAGKTVLLASQFHKLHETGPNRSFFLDGNFEQDLDLGRTYTQVRDTQRPWPLGTTIGDQREFLFDCHAAHGADSSRAVFCINYLDYAGELLEPPEGRDEDLPPGRLNVAAEIETRARDADGVLVILDGRRVLQSFQGEEAGRDYFERRMWPLLALARRVTCPVQLVLTKWDLIRALGEPTDNDNDRLEEIASHLMAYGAVRDLIREHTRRQVQVRLIPVSAVGWRFAELSAEGKVTKLAGGRLEPLHVEVPLCAVVPDMLKNLERSLSQPARRSLDQRVRHRQRIASSVAAALHVPGAASLRSEIALRYGASHAEAVLEMLTQRRLGDNQPPPTTVHAVSDQFLRNSVVAEMEQIVAAFQDELTNSIVTSS